MERTGRRPAPLSLEGEQVPKEVQIADAASAVRMAVSRAIGPVTSPSAPGFLEDAHHVRMPHSTSEPMLPAIARAAATDQGPRHTAAAHIEGMTAASSSNRAMGSDEHDTADAQAADDGSDRTHSQFMAIMEETNATYDEYKRIRGQQNRRERSVFTSRQVARHQQIVDAQAQAGLETTALEEVRPRRQRVQVAAKRRRSPKLPVTAAASDANAERGGRQQAAMESFAAPWAGAEREGGVTDSNYRLVAMRNYRYLRQQQAASRAAALPKSKSASVLPNLWMAQGSPGTMLWLAEVSKSRISHIAA